MRHLIYLERRNWMLLLLVPLHGLIPGGLLSDFTLFGHVSDGDSSPEYKSYGIWGMKNVLNNVHGEIKGLPQVLGEAAC